MSESRYRVRDRNTASGPGKVWGENLSLQEATALKERVVTSRKSKTARVEDMTSPESGELGSLQTGAKAAAAQAAAAANERHRTTVAAVAILQDVTDPADEEPWLSDNELDSIMKLIHDVDQEGLEVDELLEMPERDQPIEREPIRND